MSFSRKYQAAALIISLENTKWYDQQVYDTQKCKVEIEWALGNQIQQKLVVFAPLIGNSSPKPIYF